MARTDINILIGRNIRHRRLLCGLSQKAVGKHLGVTFQQVQKYEQGTSGIDCEKLIKLAPLFGCSIAELCEGAADTNAYDPAHPWNPYKVHPLMSHFNRIRSHLLRDKVCGLVKAIADIEPADLDATL